MVQNFLMIIINNEIGGYSTHNFSLCCLNIKEQSHTAALGCKHTLVYLDTYQ